MGKKGNWFSAIKKAFIGSSKDKPDTTHLEKKNSKEKKKWAFGKHKNSEINTFIPLCREPSSIEKILGDAEKDLEEPYKRHHQLPPNRRSVENDRAQYETRYRGSVEHERAPYYHSKRSVEVYNQGDPYRNVVHQVPSNRLHYVQEVEQNRSPQVPAYRFKDPDRELEQKRVHQVHLQKAQSERDLHHRETQVVPKKSQMVHARRPRINPNLAHASALKIQKAFRGYLARRNYRALKGLIRLQAMMRGHGVKRQTMETMKCMRMLVKVQSQIHARRLAMMESRASQPQPNARGDYLWNDSVLTKDEVEARMKRKVEAVMKRERALAYAYSHQLLKATPATASAILTDLHAGANSWCWTPFDRHTPDESYAKPKIRHPIQTQFELNSPQPEFASSKPKLKPKTKPNPIIIRDDESLTSCPPLAVPNYMTPTVSAKAKVKARVQEKREDKRRFSFGLGQSMGSIKWGKGSERISNAPSEVSRRHRSTLSVASGFSIDSTVSMPVVVGRRPFK